MNETNKKYLIGALSVVVLMVIGFFGVKSVIESSAANKAEKKEALIAEKIVQLNSIAAKEYEANDESFKLLVEISDEETAHLAKELPDSRLTEPYEEAVYSLRKPFSVKYYLEKSLVAIVTKGFTTEDEVKAYFAENMEKIEFLSKDDNYKYVFPKDDLEEMKSRLDRDSEYFTKENEEVEIKKVLDAVAEEEKAAKELAAKEAEAKLAAENKAKEEAAKKPSNGGNTANKPNNDSNKPVNKPSNGGNTASKPNNDANKPVEKPDNGGGNKPTTPPAKGCGPDRPAPDWSIVGWRAPTDENGNEIPNSRTTTDECGWIRDPKGNIIGDYYDFFGGDF